MDFHGFSWIFDSYIGVLEGFACYYSKQNTHTLSMTLTCSDLFERDFQPTEEGVFRSYAALIGLRFFGSDTPSGPMGCKKHASTARRMVSQERPKNDRAKKIRSR